MAIMSSIIMKKEKDENVMISMKLNINV